MKKKLCLLFCGSLFTFLLVFWIGCNKSKEIDLPEVIDMGILRETDGVYSITKTFKIKNNSNEELKIDGLHPTCSCLHVLDFPKKIARYSTGEVSLKMTLDKIERRTVKLYLALNDKNKGTKEITVSGRTPDGITIVPAAMDLGKVNKAQEYSRRFYLNVYTSTDDNVTITKIENSQSFVKIEKTPKKEVTYFPLADKAFAVKSTEYKLLFNLSVGHKDGPNATVILLHFSNGSTAKLSVTWINENQ